MQHITQGLNQQQNQAVTAEPSNLLVLAGAGSGKTRVLVHRIAWLIQNEDISPHAVLAVTFTNKAAKEMQARVESIIGISAKSLWIGTFHGLAHRLLRLHWQLAKLPQTFQICDSDDQLRLIKRIQKDLNLEDNYFPPKQTQYYINKQKEKGLRFKDLGPGKDYTEKYLQEVYRTYEQQTSQLGLVDFAEILLRVKELFVNNPDIRQHYQNRFKYILVDEFQDTNDLQYSWLKLLHNDNYFFMVGDDDQSIYSWRGAKVENIQKFCKDYKDAKIIRLEQNYRSTSNILNVANSLISNNSNRMGKNLWTQDTSGEKITLYQALNDIDEARYVVEQVKNYNRQGIALSEMAVLYRANHQSRQFEDSLLKANVPYRIYGGQRFFERAEIKDALAYLRLTANPFDDAALDRIINWPTRGIGQTSLNIIRGYAKENSLSLWHSLEGVINQGLLKNKAKTSVEKFIELIKHFSIRSKQLSIDKLVDEVIEQSGLRDHYYKDDKSKDKSRVENLDELVSACSVFEQELALQNNAEIDSQNLTTLQAFLAHAVLESGETQAKEYEDSLNLMTMHSAKGLEFKLVFIVGLEEGLFPHEMCMTDEVQLAEERRLCYVGVTRAMQKLYLTYCETRRFRGQDRYNMPSRFLKEIPHEFLDLEGVTTRVEARENYNRYSGHYQNDSYNNRFSRQAVSTAPKYKSISGMDKVECDYMLGQTVNHAKFGVGTILNADGVGDKARVQVKFKKPHGIKWLVAKIAKLEVLS